MINNTPLVSIIIPTYNRAHLIKRSVESVLNQTYKNLELIVVDDGSIDNTKEIIDSFDDKRLKYVYQTNLGAGAARKKGITLAKGQYISFQDSDDIWHLDKIEQQFSILQEKDADVVFCKLSLFENLKEITIPKNLKEGFLKKEDLPFQIGTQTLFGKKEVFINIVFDEKIACLEDFELLLRIQKKYSIYCIDKAMVDYYIQEDSLSSNFEKQALGWEQILKKHKELLNTFPKNLDFLSAVTLYIAFKIKDKQTKTKLIKLAFQLSKSKKTKIRYCLHKFYFYKTRELMYKTISKVTRLLTKQN